MHTYLLLQLFSCYSVRAFVLPRNLRQQSRVVVNGIWPFGKSNMPSSSSSSPPWSAIEFQEALSRQPDNGNRWDELDHLLRSQESMEERTRFEDILTGRGDANHKANLRLFGAPGDPIIYSILLTRLSYHKANLRLFGAPGDPSHIYPSL